MELGENDSPGSQGRTAFWCGCKAHCPQAFRTRAGYFHAKMPLFYRLLVKKDWMGWKSPDQPDGKHGLLLNWYL